MIVTDRELVPAAVESIDAIMQRYLRVSVDKALNPQLPRNFVLIQNRFARALQRAASGTEAETIRRVAQRLDVDWASMTAAQRDALMRAARGALSPMASQAIPRVERAMNVEAPRIVQSSRTSIIGQYGLDISSSLSLHDHRVAQFVVDSNVNFVRDEYGRRRERFSANARQIVADGMEQGLGRDEIAEQLGEEVQGASLERDPAYWRVVAGAFVGRARSETNVGAFAEAGITKYRFEAILDEATSEICRFMHGREFSVGKAMQRFAETSNLDDPEKIKDAMPWATMGVNDDGDPELYYNSEGEAQSIATVDEPGMGEADAVGEYSGAMSNEDLEAAGITMPPLHGNCRSTIIAEV